MELERKPEPGQIWRHYKNVDYKIILVTGQIITDVDLWKIDDEIESIRHSETGYECLLAYENDKSALVYEHLVYIGNYFEHPHVIYQGVDPKFTVWARPLDNFLAMISSKYIEGVDTKLFPRFDRRI